MENPYLVSPFDKEMEVKLKTLYSDVMELEEAAFIEVVGTKLNSDEINDIRKVIEFGKAGHYGERFIDKQYFSHALRVSRFVAIFLIDTADEKEIPAENGRTGFHLAMIAALLHNCFEKNLLSRDEFSKLYGNYCAKAVDYMTVNRELMKTEAGVKQYYEDLSNAPRWISCMRALDKADNLLVLHINPDDKVRADYVAEFRKYFIPMVMKKEKHLGELLNELCDWASIKPHSIPSPEEIESIEWQYKPLSLENPGK